MTSKSVCILFSEATLRAMKEKSKEPETVEPEPEPTTEVLFLCSYEGCGKTFIDAGALRKHSHIHGERQYVCHYENCGKVIYYLLLNSETSVIVRIVYLLYAKYLNRSFKHLKASNLVKENWKLYSGHINSTCR